MSLTQFDNYLVNFPHLEATEVAGCEGHITEDEIWEALKKVGKDKTLDTDGSLYEVYLRLLPMFVLLLKILFNHWIEQGTIPQHFTRSRAKHGGEGISNFLPLMILNAELKIWAKFKE